MGNRFSEQDINENKAIGILISVFCILFFLPYVVESQKNSPYLKFRANQSLIIVLFGVASGIIGAIPLLGWLLGGLTGLVTTVLVVINLINACMGNDKPLPVIGEIEILK